ncbi:pre-piRNA 3'-exonuclease trimmer-like [Oratosquilla oratoria]|uniref:pre-piRNA 3'-exonuclease trimmer-like n=1 Tax=Oratosquilla oratoria TaxID=337810 RepID=UPI003F75FE81
MVDVVKENFEELLPQIKDTIKACSFVAIDTEFTGLMSDVSFKSNLFDDGAKRFHKLSKSTQKFTICQLGMSLYAGTLDSNAYNVTTYNFYLCPSSLASHDETFLCQASSLEFLKKYKFDFNKWLYNGISYINQDQENALRTEISAIAMGQSTMRLSYEVKDQLPEISTWLSTAEEGDTKVIPSFGEYTSDFGFMTAIRLRFDTAHVVRQNGEIVIEKVSPGKRQHIDSQDPSCEGLVNDYIDKILGFTHVFRYLLKCQKPIVLHNPMLDLILMYKQFYQSLPSSYAKFKEDYCNLFPMIYDTKYLAGRLKWKLKDAQRNGNNKGSAENLHNFSLGSLAKSLQDQYFVLYRPVLKFVPEENKYNTKETFYHEAGYDAFLTGYCFLNMAHIFSLLQMQNQTQHRPLSPREHVFAFKNFCNKLVVQQAAISFIDLNGQDPHSRRPPWVVVERQNGKVLNPDHVSVELRQFGLVDTMPRNSRSVIVAAASWDCAQDILRCLKNDPVLKVQKYSHIRHSPVMRRVAWSSVLLSGLGVILIYTALKK